MDSSKKIKLAKKGTLKNGPGKISATKPTMDVLNDDCLVHIFNFLYDPSVLSRVELVCKRWQRLMSCKSTWKRVKVYPNLSHNYLEVILKKCGDRVINLKLEFCETLKRSANVMEIISKYCSKLLHLDLFFSGYFDIDDFDLVKFPFLKNLRSFALQDFESDFHDLDFVKRVLQSVEVTREHFEELVVCDAGEKRIIIEVKKKELIVCNFGYTKDLDLNYIFEEFPEITDFKVFYKDDYYNFDFSLYNNLNLLSNRVTSLSLKEISQNCFKGSALKTLKFESLKQLVIKKCSAVTDAAIKTLVSNSPKLEVVDFSVNKKLTDAAYKSLKNLKELKTLTLRKANLTGKTLVAIAENCNKLQEICCPSSPSLLATELIRIVEQLPELKFMRTLGFKNLTKANLQTISNCVKQRSNNINLEIEFVDGKQEDAIKLNLSKKNSASSSALTITVISLIRETDLAAFKSWRDRFDFCCKKRAQFYDDEDPQYYRY